MLILNLGTTFVLQILSNIANEIMKPVFMKMTSMRLVLSFVFAFGVMGLQAQNQLKFKINGLQNTEVYLANYYGNKLYYNDTAKTDDLGFVKFEGKKFEEGGKYALVTPGPKFFEFLVADEDIYIETNVNNLVEDMVIHQSENNKVFYEYLNFISDKRKEREPIDAVLNDSTATEKEQKPYREQLEKLNQEVIDFQKNIVAEHSEKLVGKILNLAVDIEVPEDIKKQGEEDPAIQYYWYRTHYFDNVDLNDPRLVRDQMFHRLLEKYYTKILPQIPDTLCNEAIKLAEMMGNYDMKKYTIHYITYSSETSNIMCMDKVFVRMVDEYYKTGKADWLDEEQLAKVIESADKKRNVLCGEPVMNIILPDTSGLNWESLYAIDAKYTVIMIWESTCGHCKKELPVLLDLYHDWKDRGLEVYAIGNDFETEPWIKYVKEKNLDWINVSDNPEINDADSARVLILNGTTTLPSLNFRTTFDVFSTPKLLLLDKDKRIIAKQLSAEQLEDLLTKLEKDEQEKENGTAGEDRGEVLPNTPDEVKEKKAKKTKTSNSRG